MIRYALNCDQGHSFESWFANSAAYEGQAKKRLIAAFATLDDEDLIGTYRRRMASLLF